MIARRRSQTTTGVITKTNAKYRTAIRRDQQSARRHNGLSVVYYDRKRFDEAIAEYLTAIRLEPQSADPHNNLGSVYGALQRYDEAIAEYQTALRLDPNNQGIAANLKLAQDAKAQAGK